MAPEAVSVRITDDPEIFEILVHYKGSVNVIEEVSRAVFDAFVIDVFVKVTAPQIERDSAEFRREHPDRPLVQTQGIRKLPDPLTLPGNQCYPFVDQEGNIICAEHQMLWSNHRHLVDGVW